MKKEPKITNKGNDKIRDALLKQAIKLQNAIKRRVPVDRGALRASIQISERERSVIVGTNLVYAEAIEFGTPPFYPPIAPLKIWSRRKLGDESAAYAVQQKIAKEGITPQPYFRPGMEELRKRRN